MTALKRLEPDPTRDDLGTLLEEPAFFARQETMACEKKLVSS